MQTRDNRFFLAVVVSTTALACGTACGPQGTVLAAGDDGNIGTDATDVEASCLDTGCAAGESCDAVSGECAVSDAETPTDTETETDTEADTGAADGCSPACEVGVAVCSPLKTCVPDCRVSGATCPGAFPICEESTGLCRPSPDGGGEVGGATCETGCVSGVSVCAPNQSCVPDCRVSGNSCPAAALACDPIDGLCKPNETAPTCETGCVSGVSVCAPNHTCVPDCRTSALPCPALRPTCDATNGLCI